MNYLIGYQAQLIQAPTGLENTDSASSSPPFHLCGRPGGSPDGTNQIQARGSRLIHGESVLTRRRGPSLRMAAGVFGHAQIVEHQADVARQTLDGRGDGVAGFRLDGADGEAA